MTPENSDYPDRYALANELHARPFPKLRTKGRAIFFAIKQPVSAVARDRSEDRVHLKVLLDRFGVAHPPPEASHHSVSIGRGTLKWEQHTEFVTYTLFTETPGATAFDPAIAEYFPADWLAAAPGKILTSCLVHIDTYDPDEDLHQIIEKLPDWFVSDSLAMSRVVDNCAIIASDFRIDPAGHTRFAVLTRANTGESRLGRIVQRLLEIETYKSLAILGLPVARSLAKDVSALDKELSDVGQNIANAPEDDGSSLDRLLKISARIELLSAGTAFRFGATGAYEAIVDQRIEVLREERVQGRQTFAEFMMRRFDPAMRTCRSAQKRLADLSVQAERTANLLRTRVDVANAAQNVEVLRRMDDRAALQLRLQETVEGLSVVAISYYAANLAANLILPFGKMLGLSKTGVMGLITVPVIFVVWLIIRRIRRASQKPH